MTMNISTPDWLSTRGARLGPAVNGNSFLVLFNGDPQYQLVVAPAKGKFTCAITQTNNGRRLDKGLVYPGADDALRGGLAELRELLGW
jgi:hypothetical protein